MINQYRGVHDTAFTVQQYFENPKDLPFSVFCLVPTTYIFMDKINKKNIFLIPLLSGVVYACSVFKIICLRVRIRSTGDISHAYPQHIFPEK